MISKITAAANSAESKLVGGCAGGNNEKVSIKKYKKITKKILIFISMTAAAKPTGKNFIFGGGGA